MKRILACVLAALVLIPAQSANAADFEDEYTRCSYDRSAGRLNVKLLDSSPVEYMMFGNGFFRIPENLDDSHCDEAVTGPLDRIVVDDVANGHGTFTVRQLGPGATPEVNGQSELELSLDLGPAPNRVQLYKWAGFVELASPTAIHTNTDDDVDITLAPTVRSWAVVGPAVVRSSLGTGHVVRVSNADDVKLGGSADTVSGLTGDDTILTDGGNDVLRGHAGKDVLKAGDGNDTLDGGRAPDLLFGGRGDDRFDGLADGTKDTVQCGPGFDTVGPRDAADVIASDCEQRL